MTGSKRPTARAAHWGANLLVLGLLLPIWFAVSFGCGIFFVERLNEHELGGYPLGFWFAHQGSIYAFVVIILIYAFVMDRLDGPATRGAAPPADPSDAGAPQ